MKKSRGFTLIELMVTIAIVATLTTLAAPSFKHLIQSNSISSAVNTFLGDMRFARSEGIRRGGGVVMCRSDTPEATAPTCGANNGPDQDGDSMGDGWVSGWIVFHDLDNSGNKNANEPLLRVQSTIKSVDSVMEGGSSSSTKFVFTATGRLKNLSSSATTLTFGGGNFATSLERVVCVSVGGRARIAVDSDGNANGDAACGSDK